MIIGRDGLLNKLLNDKNKFIMYVILEFVYVGITVYITKFQSSHLKLAFSKHLVINIGIAFSIFVLTIMNTIKLNKLKLNMMNQIEKTYDILYCILFETFLGSTLYVYFTGIVLNLFEGKIGLYLNKRIIIVNFCIILFSAFKMLYKRKEMNLKKIGVFSILALLILQLTVIDFLVIVIYLMVSKLDLSEEKNKFEFKIKHLEIYISLVYVIMTLVFKISLEVFIYSVFVMFIILMNVKKGYCKNNL